MPKTAKKVYETILSVTGSGEFPFDMLRYDSCHPHEESDSALLGEAHQESREVTLRRFSPSGRPATSERWASFGWRGLSERQAEP